VLGVDVGWDGATQTATLTSVGNATLVVAPAPALTTPTANQSQTVNGYEFFGLSVKGGSIPTGTVEVKNTNASSKTSVMFTISFYDSNNNNRIGTAIGAIVDFASGETKTVHLICQEDVSGYSSVRYQIDIEL
jgi:hypothetical protein